MKLKSEKGITLIALIITIIVLIILAAVTIKILTHDGLAQLAAKAGESYQKSQDDEMGMLNEVEYNIKAGLNKKPVFDYIEVSEMKPTSAKIKAKAIDTDGDKLTYILYMGTTMDSLIEKDKIEQVEQGTEVELEGTEINTGELVYYRLDVLDQYAIVKSQISTIQNKVPEIKKAEIKDITRVSAKAVVMGTDEDTENLTYKIIYRKK